MHSEVASAKVSPAGPGQTLAASPAAVAAEDLDQLGLDGRDLSQEIPGRLLGGLPLDEAAADGQLNPEPASRAKHIGRGRNGGGTWNLGEPHSVHPMAGGYNISSSPNKIPPARMDFV
jgi:hypothetical protein